MIYIYLIYLIYMPHTNFSKTSGDGLPFYITSPGCKTVTTCILHCIASCIFLLQITMVNRTGFTYLRTVLTMLLLAASAFRGDDRWSWDITQTQTQWSVNSTLSIKSKLLAQLALGATLSVTEWGVRNMASLFGAVSRCLLQQSRNNGKFFHVLSLTLILWVPTSQHRWVVNIYSKTSNISRFISTACSTVFN